MYHCAERAGYLATTCGMKDGKALDLVSRHDQRNLAVDDVHCRMEIRVVLVDKPNGVSHGGTNQVSVSLPPTVFDAHKLHVRIVPIVNQLVLSRQPPDAAAADPSGVGGHHDLSAEGLVLLGI